MRVIYKLMDDEQQTIRLFVSLEKLEESLWSVFGKNPGFVTTSAIVNEHTSVIFVHWQSASGKSHIRHKYYIMPVFEGAPHHAY